MLALQENEAREMGENEVTRTRVAQGVSVPFLALVAWAVGLTSGQALAAGAEFGPDVASSPALDRFTPEQKKQLLAGKAVYEHVVEDADADNPSGRAKAIVLIHAPVEECFRRFSEIEKHTLYFPRKTVSRVEGVREDGRVSVYKEFDFKLKTIRFHVLYTIDPEAHRIDFNLDESQPGDLKASKGYFQFFAVTPDTSLFDYGLINTSVGLKIPAFIRSYLTSKDLPRVVTNYRNWLESGGTWTK